VADLHRPSVVGIEGARCRHSETEFPPGRMPEEQTGVGAVVVVVVMVVAAAFVFLEEEGLAPHGFEFRIPRRLVHGRRRKGLGDGFGVATNAKFDGFGERRLDGGHVGSALVFAPKFDPKGIGWMVVVVVVVVVVVAVALIPRGRKIVAVLLLS